ncbi:hypothetical protein MSG28_003653 [Choristoneura fumiferana]|uniref:Uncharacterized protein n=1 Tax=Choristoneura fumiferana TaxID=7141 RepID=A0ACC0KFY1_CHOFU|nr:hypothetical protein MSG28_003653 [Choristoneura fumiferana]
MNLRLHVFFGQFLWLIAVLNGKTFQGIPGYGRNLVIKTLPAIEDYQSNVYEVYMEPYLYDLRRPAYALSGDRTQKQIDLAGAPRSLPGLQAIVNLQADEESGVGGELVFTQIVPNGPGRHGGPRDHIRHVGDLGNIKAEEGTVNVKIVDHLISLAGPRSIVGRSVAITKGEDDYGRAGTEDSALTGTSGPAIACGIIGYVN